MVYTPKRCSQSRVFITQDHMGHTDLNGLFYKKKLKNISTKYHMENTN